MKKIYNSDNVKKILLSLQKRMKVTTNRSYKANEIIYAFNKLPGNYQDLLLKIDKNENDKANLNKVYNMIKLTLVKTKDIPNDVKIDIKNIYEEEEKRKNVVTMEDVETGGDKWVRPEPKKKPILVKELETPKIEQPITIKTKKEPEPIKEEIEVVQNKVQEEVKNDNYRDIILKKYIKERRGLDIKAIIKELNIDSEIVYIIESKFENNSVISNDELEKIIGVKKNYIDQVVDEFYDRAIEQKKKKLLALERK